jgi:hypothetical protein
MSRKILTFSSLPFSGSTYLGKSLSTFGNTTYLGETNRLKVFSDFNNPPPTACSDCAVLGQICSFWSNNFISSLNHLSRTSAFNQLLEVFRSRIVIDGSKFHEMCNHHPMIYQNFSNSFEIFSLLLIREPLDWAASFCLAVDPDQPENFEQDALYCWKTGISEMIQRLHLFKIPYKVVQTEHLWESHLEHERTMNAILEFVNFDLTDLSLPPSANHQIGGNEYVLNLANRDVSERNEDMKRLKNRFHSSVLNDSEIQRTIRSLGLSY